LFRYRRGGHLGAAPLRFSSVFFAAGSGNLFAAGSGKST
jgi:hypothetical protein